MIQCADCEFFRRDEQGRVYFACDPFATIKEAECLTKWTLLRTSEVAQKLDRIVAAQEGQAEAYRRLQPLQEKMFKHMEREIEASDESEKWKVDDDDDGDGNDHEWKPDDEDDNPYPR